MDPSSTHCSFLECNFIVCHQILLVFPIKLHLLIDLTFFIKGTTSLEKSDRGQKNRLIIEIHVFY